MGQLSVSGPHDTMALSAKVGLGCIVTRCNLLAILLSVAKEGAKVQGQVHLHLLASGCHPHHWIPAAGVRNSDSWIQRLL